jgi:hypothetical protein
VNPSKAIWFASAVKELISATVALVMVVDCLGLVDNADAQTPSSAGTTNPQCVNVFHDDTTGAKDGKGSINAIYLANLLGHWPAYEVRVRPVQNYKAGMSDACKATFYIGSFESTAVPKAFLHDYFATRRSVVWMGFGTERLDQEQFQRAFAFEPKGKLTARFMPSGPPAFFAHVTYKGSVFNRQAVKTRHRILCRSVRVRKLHAGQSRVADDDCRSRATEQLHGRKKAVYPAKGQQVRGRRCPVFIFG